MVVVEATVDFAMLEKCTVHMRDQENDRWLKEYEGRSEANKLLR